MTRPGRPLRPGVHGARLGRLREPGFLLPRAAPPAEATDPSDIFAVLPQHLLNEIDEREWQRTYDRRQCIADGSADSYGIVRSGRARSVVRTATGNSVVVDVHGPGQLLFGVPALAESAGCRGSARIESGADRTRVSWLSPAGLTWLHDPPHGGGFLQRLYRRRYAVQQCRAINSVLPANVRVAAVLAELCALIGRADGGQIALVGMSQGDVAECVGVSVCTVEEVLRDLRKRGILRSDYRLLTILCPAQLLERAAGAWGLPATLAEPHPTAAPAAQRRNRPRQT